MALTTSPRDSRFNDILVLETALGNGAVADLRGGPASVYSIDINNPSSAACFVKLYDTTKASASDIPVIIIMIINPDRRVITIPDGIPFANGVTMRCVTTPGTGGVTPPSGGSGTVAVSLVMK